MSSRAWIAGNERRVGTFSKSGGEGNVVVRADGGGVEVRRDGLCMAAARGLVGEESVR